MEIKVMCYNMNGGLYEVSRKITRKKSANTENRYF
jgi:hypothetical protein